MKKRVTGFWMFYPSWYPVFSGVVPWSPAALLASSISGSGSGSADSSTLAQRSPYLRGRIKYPRKPEEKPRENGRLVVGWVFCQRKNYTITLGNDAHLLLFKGPPSKGVLRERQCTWHVLSGPIGAGDKGRTFQKQVHFAQPN